MFSIGKDLAKNVISGEIQPSNLVLLKKETQQGRTWELKNSSEIDRNIPEIAAQIFSEGQDLVEIFRSVANGETVDHDLTDLVKSQKFRVFSKNIPGMEAPDHRERVRASLKSKIDSVKSTLAVVLEGASQLRAKGKPWRTVNVQKDYLLAEVVLKNYTIPVSGAYKISDLWKDSDTTLGIDAWVTEKQQEWSMSQSTETFLTYLMSKNWKEKEIKAWESSHPGEICTETQLDDWRATQQTTLLGEPDWFLRELWEKDNVSNRREHKPETTFDQWVKNTTDGRKGFWKEELKKPQSLYPFRTMDDQTFSRLDKKCFEYMAISGSSLDASIWIVKEFWKESNPNDVSDDAFIRHIELIQCNNSLNEKLYAKISKCQAHLNRLSAQLEHVKKGKTGRSKRQSLQTQIDVHKNRLEALHKELEKKIKIPPTDEVFEEWKLQRDQQIEDRWRATRISLSLEDWKAQQVFQPLVPIPFVSLDAEKREAYRTDCSGGYLVRNGAPISTAAEMTAHSGKGTVIFVIGPDNDLYTASHLPGVFHHSSFLGDSAVMAAGELKTDREGKIVHISSKSGHYLPTDQENRAMLMWFRVRGVNLDEVTFSCYLEGGKISQEMSSLKYLTGLVNPIPQ